MKRRDLQQAHEAAVLDSFSEYCRQRGIIVDIMERHDPSKAPDARVIINALPSWIEITDAYQDRLWAQSITTYAASDMPHKPRPSTVVINPDELAYERVREVILKKYEKETIRKEYEERGKGILLVGIYTPLTSSEEIFKGASESILSMISRQDPIFSEIYLYQNTTNGHDFLPLGLSGRL